MAGNPFISARLFSFLKDLKKNNNRDWFADNKNRFENDVREPLIDFIAAFSEDLYKISKHLEANTKKVGGSLFRIYRDVRFSKDKSPYKTNVGVHFRHEDAKDAHAPGYYLHLEPGEVFFAAGIWHPDSEALKQIRSHIVENSPGWKRAIGGSFKSELKLEGDSLKRGPVGIDPDHPLIEDLKRKDFIGVASLTQKEVCGEKFVENFAARCTKAKLLMKFLAEALRLPF